MKKIHVGISSVSLMVLSAILVIGFIPGEAAAKTASPISVTYSAPDKISVGKEIQISIVIKAPSGTKQLSLKLSPEEGLAIKTPAGGVVNFGDQPDGASLTQTVTVTASKEGRLFLNVLASGVVSGKETSDAISVPLDIGDVKQPVMKQGKEVTDSAGRKLSVMPAGEPKNSCGSTKVDLEQK
ncbi:MAG: hypothetical protein WC889_17050 [Myxococcota bacterium]|jgi:hypothetical protein